MIAVFTETGFIIDLEATRNKSFFFDDTLYQEFKENQMKALFYFGFLAKKSEMSPSLLFLHYVGTTFIKSLANHPSIEFTREANVLSEDELADILQAVPFAIGTEYINRNWVIDRWSELSGIFSEVIKDYPNSVAAFLVEHDASIHIVGRVFFHLVENKSEEYPFAFLATYSTRSNQKTLHTPLKNALLEYKGEHESLLELLSTVSKATDKSEFISELVESGELFSPLKFTSTEAYVFLNEIALYEDCGILCRIPDWWHKKTNSLKVSISVGDKEPAKVGLDALLSFRPELYFGSEKVSKEELDQLLTQTNGLALLKGKWVEVDHEKLTATLAAYENAMRLSENGSFTLAEAMRSQLQLTNPLQIDNEEVDIEIANGQWLQTIQSRLLQPEEIENLAVGTDFKATLRHYQQTGFDWLHLMKSLGFGALLADDMGLGKTVQILALLEYLREQGHSKTLLIVPASLIGNWQKEIEKFTPLLTYKILHGAKENLDLEQVDGIDLYITTYGMAVKLEELQEINWDLLILDEAQAIKNPNTKQTKVMKKMQAKAKIAMTGTPIENKLADLWSLFDFLNSGLLGTAKEFTTFTKQLKNTEDYTKLRNVVAPFTLRRVKTDKTIISDLPDKIETKAYTTLTKKQIVLYKKLVQDIEKQLETADGIARRGLVLASIIKFKQICNHPDQYLGQTEFKHTYSGKFAKLADICETIYEKRERVLVFTQFREMTQPIADYLEIIFQRKGLILHGGTPVKKRTALVEEFCSEEYVPFMVLSLKAGGVGLNLTSANHVIHFDRWWNPAIENQATDRAFRIGQQKNVIVHKFITEGTIEEKIDAMIEEKQKLAGDIIASSGENWITELSNDELMELFTFV